MKVEKRETGITLIAETEFEKEALIWMQKEDIGKMYFEDGWEQKGRFYIDFDRDWGK